MPKIKERPGTVTVRCLGPGPEHVFLSRDPRTNRICESCVRKMAAIGTTSRDPISVTARE